MNQTSSTVAEISPVSEISDEHAIQFFRELKAKLNFSSTRKTVALVRIVLAKLRASYTIQQMKEILSKTPSVFHLLLISQCRYEEDKKEIGHLDEIVESLYQDDKTTGKGLFKSELDALGSVTLVLRKIEKLFKSVGLLAFNYTLTHELQQAAQEEGL